MVVNVSAVLSYSKWLDRWDEERASLGDRDKAPSPFLLQPELAFDGSVASSTLDAFCSLARLASVDPQYFREDADASQCWSVAPESVQFPSAIVTDVTNNNIVRASITPGRGLKRAVVLFHHWNARSRQTSLAKLLAWAGITVVEIEMPYHFSRHREGSRYADYMLSPNLGRTMQSVRQAVLDGRRLVRFLKGCGYENIAVLGMSLGSWIAGLVAAHDPAVSKAALLLTGGDLAEMVWTGRATQHIRTSLEPNIHLSDLRRAWLPFSLEQYSPQLARAGLEIQVILARRDKVVRPEVSERFVERMTAAGSTLVVSQLNCGHYSLGLPPHNLEVAWKLIRFLA